MTTDTGRISVNEEVEEEVEEVGVKGGVLIYRCRRCGEIDKSTHVPDISTALICINGGHTMPEQWGRAFEPKMTDIHVCSERYRGISDLIGGEIDKS